MPTTYAHWRFGVDCIGTLPEDYRQAVLNHRELFDVGVHGPDVFFYDLRHPELPKYGSNIHHEPSRIFFERAIEVYKRYDEDKEAMLSYILGFLSHFAFDSQAHAYINNKDLSSELLSHNKVEAEYDGHLIRQDGRSVAKTDRAASLKPKKEYARIMARFFPFDEKQMLRTFRMQKFLLTGLNCRSDFKRNGLAKILDKLNMSDYRDLIVPVKESDLCKDSDLRIDKLKAYALELYPGLVEDIRLAIEEDKKLGAYFDRDFDPEPDETTPVLSYEDELDYTPVKNII